MVKRNFPKTNYQRNLVYSYYTPCTANSNSHRQSEVISPNIPTKSGLMLGLGETRDELLATIPDLLGNGL